MRGRQHPQKFLEQQLMQPVQELRRAALESRATPDHAERLASVCSSHASDWLRGPGRWFTLAKDEARQCGRWVIGVPLHHEPYNCPWCGVVADAQGLHAVACEASGHVPRGHTGVKCVLAELYRAAGARVELEQHTDDRPDRRPADLLVLGIFALGYRHHGVVQARRWPRPA